MFRKSILPLLAGLISLSACQSKSSNSETKKPTAQKDSVPTATATDVKLDPKASNYSFFVAGMDSSISGDEHLLDLAKSKGYKTYAKSMTDNFAKIEKDRLGPMRQWANTEINKNLESKTLFYPFSGPDILHATTFYPGANTYILMALEIPGGFPNFAKKDTTTATGYLQAVMGALNDVFNKSYFITSYMNRKVNFDANGTAPIMCLFLARSGYQVLDIEKRKIQEDGTDVALSSDTAISYDSNRYLLIHFKQAGSNEIKNLIYFSTNICDDPYPADKPGLKKNKALVAWLEKHVVDCNTYLKSASYLMHNDNYSIIRNIILKFSKSVLQDDTGIAYRYFDKSKWNFTLYGGYVKPVKDFGSGTYQGDLRDAYAKDSVHVKKLSYSLGYHWQNQAGQNLMKAERK